MRISILSIRILFFQSLNENRKQWRIQYGPLHQKHNTDYYSNNRNKLQEVQDSNNTESNNKHRNRQLLQADPNNATPLQANTETQISSRARIRLMLISSIFFAVIVASLSVTRAQILIKQTQTPQQSPLPSHASHSSNINGFQQQQQQRHQQLGLAYPQAQTSQATPQNQFLPQQQLQKLSQIQSYDGIAVDLVGINQRRFEKFHNHHVGGNHRSDQESSLEIVPEAILNRLPHSLGSDIVEDIANDPMSILNIDNSLQASESANLAASTSSIYVDDLDKTASIQRLSKSCMTVHTQSSDPEQLNVTFLLFTRNNFHVPYIITPYTSRMELVQSSPFDGRKPIKWITHGFRTTVDKSSWMLESKDRILGHEDANVILTDWRKGASPALAFYPKAAANAHVVARMIVNVLRKLDADILDTSRIHLIGHSLGAHIMGFVGSAFTEDQLAREQQMLRAAESDPQSQRRFSVSNRMIGRITACDPALPCFGSNSVVPTTQTSAYSTVVANPLMPSATNGKPPMVVGPVLQRQSKGTHHPSTPPHNHNPHNAPYNQYKAAHHQHNHYPQQHEQQQSDTISSYWTHLRPDSAILVEVIHTNPGVMGYVDPLGDYDFYPNGLKVQPGCQSSQSGGNGNNVGDNNKQANDGRGNVESRSGSVSAAARASSRFSSAIDKLIKPIKEFFNGNGCSHHRSVEYMVESLYYDRIPIERRFDTDKVCQMVGYRCLDYISFRKGFCFTCQTGEDCRAFGNGQADNTNSLNKANGMQQSSVAETTIRTHIHSPNGAIISVDSSSSSPNIEADYDVDEEANESDLEEQRLASANMRLPRSINSSFMIKMKTDPSNNSTHLKLNNSSTINDNVDRRSRVGSNQHHASRLADRTVMTIEDHDYFGDNIPEITIANSAELNHDPTRVSQSTSVRKNESNEEDTVAVSSSIASLLNVTRQLTKRILPTYNYLDDKFLPQRRSKYFFDTAPAKSFCLHHYHILVKYRWMKVEEKIVIDAIRLTGTFGRVAVTDNVPLYGFSANSYTMLVTHSHFLGALESIQFVGRDLRPLLVEFIEVTYMSNLDSKVRQFASGRFCRTDLQHRMHQDSSEQTAQQSVAPPVPPLIPASPVPPNPAMQKQHQQQLVQSQVPPPSAPLQSGPPPPPPMAASPPDLIDQNSFLFTKCYGKMV